MDKEQKIHDLAVAYAQARLAGEYAADQNRLIGTNPIDLEALKSDYEFALTTYEEIF